MKTTILSALWGAILMILSPSAMAITLTDIITYPDPLTVRDGSSGNSINAQIRHNIETPLPPDALILAHFEISHSGNSNLGPRTEIWHVFSEGLFLGALSASSTGPVKDTFELPLSLFAAPHPYVSEIGLSEQTAFNGETIKIHGTSLDLAFHDSPVKTEVPETPEPMSVLLISGGLVAWGLGRKLKL